MKFEQVNEKGEKYALLYPLYNENKVMKKAVQDAGASAALEFDKGEAAYRLYEHKIPSESMKKVERAVAKYATVEARDASVAEREEFSKKSEVAKKVSGTEIDPSKIYYAATANGDREAFNELKKETGTKFYYSAKAGGFVHTDGPTEGFERFQTPEAKAAWEAQGKEAAKANQKRRESTAEGINVMAERANGREFLADNAKGFMLPLKNQAEARNAQIEIMKKASNEELSQVFKITEEVKKSLERKLYAIQIKAAQAKGVAVEDFNKMNSEQRREASGGASMSKEDFSKMVAVMGGFFEMRDEMINRGLLQSRESALELKGKGNSADNAAPKQKTVESSSEKTAPKQKTETQQETAEAGKEAAPKSKKSKGQNIAAQMSAAALENGVGR